MGVVEEAFLSVSKRGGEGSGEDCEGSEVIGNVNH